MKLDALASAIGARLLGDAEVEVDRVRAVDEAGERDLGFAVFPRELKAAFTTKAGAILVDEAFAADHAHELPCAVLASPHASRALAKAIDALHPRSPRASRRGKAYIATTAAVDSSVSLGDLCVVGERARIGRGASIGALAYVGDDVTIGDQTHIGPGAVLLAGVTLGARVTIGPGTVVGDEGFVFAPDGDTNVVVRHVASVTIGDDVDVGANSCIDRGALRDTRIGRGTKIDNLVQIGHDVVIGEHAVIIGQVGVAGDARIGDGAVLAGQSGVKDRVVIGARARIGGQSGVTRDVDDGAAVSGMPAIPHMTWLRAMTRLQQLDGLERRVRALEAKLEARLEDATEGRRNDD